MVINIGTIRNMLDMARGHESLTRQDAQAEGLRQLMERLSDNTDERKKVMHADEPERPITFG